MIKANTAVIVKGKTYDAGQTVEGLSKLDKTWMEEKGYITEIPEAKPANQKGKSVEKGEADDL